MDATTERPNEPSPLLEKKADGVEAYAEPGADPKTSTAGIVANGNDTVDKTNPGNVGESGNAQQWTEAAGTLAESDAEVGIKKTDVEEEVLPPEVNSIQVPQHWHAKPCVHITCIGGQVKEEELLSLFGAYGQVSSISFENERRDSAVIRYEYSAGDAEGVVTKVRMALNNTKLEDRTLIVEHFRPDSLLFVGNLTPEIDDSALVRMFEPHGRVERAFVVRNAAGKSKCYGFVEYSLKGQAVTAKLSMGNINMEGRVLRVEWSDCRRVADMFSTIIFVDRLPRGSSHIEQSLRNLFGKYGKVRDCYLAIGLNQQLRGFAFIDFSHSLYADRAHQALDGHELDGSNIRVSFANPSKSVQSYKLRFGSSSAPASHGSFGRGALDNSLQPLVPGMFMGGSFRGPMGMPLLASRLMGQARPGMLGMGFGLQFGRGTLGGGGMLGPGSVAAGMMGRTPLLLGNVASRSGMGFTGNLLQPRWLTAQGASPITSAAIVQVATAQAKAREEEAKARAEAGNQGLGKQATSEQHLSATQQSLYQQQTPPSTDQQYKQATSQYPYQQVYQQPLQQQTTSQTPYQAWTQQQQTQQSYGSQYYSQPTQSYTQQQQTAQYSQNDGGYYQQSSQQVQATGTQQQYSYAQQYSYGQQYGGQQYSQQSAPNYGETYGQINQSSGQQYQQALSQQSQAPYTQQNVAEQYNQQQSAQEQAQTGASATTANAAGSVVQESSQQQAYATYYQQQAQAQAQAQAQVQAQAQAQAHTQAQAQAQTQGGTVATATSSTAASQQSYEAQWAAYYANQAAYQQAASYGQQQAYAGTTGATATYYEQPSTTDVGQK